MFFLQNVLYEHKVKLLRIIIIKYKSDFCSCFAQQLKNYSVYILEGTARYAGLLLAPAEVFGQGRGFFLPFWGEKELYTLCVLILGHFWCSAVTSVNFNNNLSNFENNPKNLKNSPTTKNSKKFKNHKNLKKKNKKKTLKIKKNKEKIKQNL